MDPIFLDQLSDLARIVISAPIMYLSIVFLIRLSGKRSTSQMNNFDWIVTVAIGSLVASGIVMKNVTVLESVGGIATLLLLQWLLTKGMLYSPLISRLVKARPVALIEDGIFQEEAMKRERLTKREVMAALRESGLVDPDQAKWVILETDATMSVIPKQAGDGPARAMEDVHGIKSLPQARRATVS